MKTLLEKRLRDPEYARLFAEEELVMMVTEKICEAMQLQNVSRAELARRLGTTRANVTQMLGGRNVSLRTIAAAVHVLGCEPLFDIQEKTALIKPFKIPSTPPAKTRRPASMSARSPN